VVLYLVAVVLDHVDGEARLVRTESRRGHWFDLTADTVVQAVLVAAAGVAVAGLGFEAGPELGTVAALGVVLSAAAAGAWPVVPATSGRRLDAASVLDALGNRHGFYALLLVFVALRVGRPTLLPALLGVVTIGSHAYWGGRVAVALSRPRRERPAAPRSRPAPGARWRRAAMLVLSVVPAVSATSAVAQGGYETPAVLRAVDLAPAALLSGPRFQVDDRVVTDGLLAKFAIRSDFGPFEAEGPGMLEVRVGEIRALDALDQASKTEAFGKALAGSAQRTGKSLATAVTNPGETIKGLPEGVGRFFERVGRGVKTGTQKAGDYVEQAEAQKAAAGRGPDTAEVASKVGEATGNVASNVFGKDDSRRRIAKHLGVDPYTTNPVLDKKLDEFAWAVWSGEFGLDRGIAMVPGGRAVTITKNWVSDLVWDLNPGDLDVRAEKQLKGGGVPQDVIDRFLRQKWFTRTIRLALVEPLVALGPVPGRGDVIRWALTAQSETQARFMAGAVGILADYHRTAAPLARIRVAGTLIGETQNGPLVIAAPVDYVSWTARLAKFTARPDLAGRPKQLWLTGRLSPRAQKELTALRWTIREGVSAGVARPGGPPSLEQKPQPASP